MTRRSFILRAVSAIAGLIALPKAKAAPVETPKVLPVVPEYRDEWTVYPNPNWSQVPSIPQATGNASAVG